MIFRKKKYYFDPLTLTFEEIKPDRKKKFLELLFYLFIILTVTFLSGYILNIVFGSPKSILLEKEVMNLNQEMHNLFEKVNHYSYKLHKEHFPKDNNYRSILQIDTLSNNTRDAGTGGSARERALSLNEDMDHKLGDMITRLNNQLQIQAGSYETIFREAREHALQFAHIPAIQPICQKDLIMISSDFGVRSDPFLEQQEVHYGLDFVAPSGTNVYATGDGTVTFIQFSRTGYGNEVVVDHTSGFGSRYAHLSQILVTEGQKVKRGQILAKVGQSGRATGPHLHYEVLYEKKPVNPEFYFDNNLTIREYQEILDLASNKAK